MLGVNKVECPASSLLTGDAGPHVAAQHRAVWTHAGVPGGVWPHLRSRQTHELAAAVGAPAPVPACNTNQRCQSWATPRQQSRRPTPTCRLLQVVVQEEVFR